jgi:hypothetical protein
MKTFTIAILSILCTLLLISCGLGNTSVISFESIQSHEIKLSIVASENVTISWSYGDYKETFPINSKSDDDYRDITLRASSVFGPVKITGKDIRKFRCNNAVITTIDVRKCPSLLELNLTDNHLTEIDISKNRNLTHLHLRRNKIANIDISKNSELTFISIAENNLSAIDISNNVELSVLGLGGNKLQNLDIRNNTRLSELYLWTNELSSIDILQNRRLTEIDIRNNPFPVHIINQMIRTLPTRSSDETTLRLNATLTSEDRGSIDAESIEQSGWTVNFTEPRI